MHTLPDAPARSGRRFMPEIQGLRAVAVGLVVLFHLWPARIPGGFVGVDVFFVISGYLITSHLMREVDASGTVRLGAFYARRARRLLPASLLVLAISAVAAAAILPAQLARSAMREVIASALYVENLWLASRAVTYSASNDTASPLQHYWSLSTEEQFYALWPALILAAAWLARRAGRGRRFRPEVGRTRAAVAGVLLALAAASLAHSILLTASDPAAAYFVTTTRAWEFAAGALLSFLTVRWTPSGAAAVGLRWAGLAAVVATSFAISQATPFPGAVALAPVLGAAAIILAGDAGASDPLLRVGNLRPVQWLGDVSYAVYLWHWPLIALGPFLLGRDLGAVDKLGVLALTGGLAHLTRRFVEQPFLAGFTRLVGAPRRTLISTVLAMAIVAGAALGHGAWLDHVGRVQLQERLAQLSSDPCAGASAALNPARCGSPFTAPPRAAVSEADSPWAMPHCDPGCWNGPRPDRVLALVGDSHAQTLYHALAPLAEAEGYGIAVYLRGACPLNLTGSDRWLGRPRERAECGDWSARTVEAVRSLAPDVIVSSAFVGSSWEDRDTGLWGYHDTWKALTAVAPVVVVRDYPLAAGGWGPECLAKNVGDHLACSLPRTDALPPDPAFDAAATAGPRVTRVDLTDLYCDAERCHAVVGTLPVYWDADHITGTFSRSLAPALAVRLDLP